MVCEYESLLPTDVRQTDYQYELYSVVIHSGAAHGGHYHAYIRDMYNEGDWDASKAAKYVEPPPPKKLTANKSVGYTDMAPEALLEETLRANTTPKAPFIRISDLGQVRACCRLFYRRVIYNNT